MTDEERRAARAAIAREWRANSPEKQREYNRRWYAANKDRVREYNRQYREANKDKIQELARRRHQENPQREIERNRRYRQSRPEWVRANTLKKHHGPHAVEAFAEMWAAQHGCCYLCGKELTRARTVIDHDHRCCPRNRSCEVCRRGLACGFCNILIGMASDSPALLRKIADNLEAARQLVQDRLSGKPLQDTLFEDAS